MKTISFAVPCFNSADYMEKCVESLLPCGDDIEIILVDDGSTKDATPEICDRLEQEHPGIVRVIHKENGNVWLFLSTPLFIVIFHGICYCIV